MENKELKSDLEMFKEAFYLMESPTPLDKETMLNAKNIDEAFVVFSELNHYQKQVFIEYLKNMYEK